MSWGPYLFLGLAVGILLVCPAARSQSGPCLPVICYHDIVPHPVNQYQVSERDFWQQLRYLKEKGYQTIPLARWRAYLAGEGPLPPRPVILTFDDGHLSGYRTVLPRLRSLGFVGSFFVPTHLLSHPRPGYLTGAQIREMAQAGMEIMPHGHRHLDLTRKEEGEEEAAYRTRIEQELRSSRRLLQALLGSPSPFLAYPFGAYDLAVEEAAKEAGFSMILTACPGVNTTRTHPLRLRRQLIYREDGLSGFVRKLEALPLELDFPFPEGGTLTSPLSLEIDLPPQPDYPAPPLVLLARRPVSFSYDHCRRRVSLWLPSPPRPRLCLLEVRLVKEGGGWCQASTLFTLLPSRPAGK